MILKGSQRGSALELGVHLLKAENEHVELRELRGFMSEDVLGAMKEIQAVARGTRCRQPLFSVSFNPPELSGYLRDVRAKPGKYDWLGQQAIPSFASVLPAINRPR